MAVFISPFFNEAQFKNDGTLAVGYKLNTYAEGSSTPLATYTSSTGLTPQANPIVLNARGEPPNPIWLTGGLGYKFVFTTDADVVIRTIDNVRGVGDNTLTVSQWLSSGLVATYITPTIFSVVGDQVSVFHVGRAVQLLTSGGTVTAKIKTSVFTTVTTITIEDATGLLDVGLTGTIPSYSVLSNTNDSLPAVIDTNVQNQASTAYTTTGTSSAYVVTTTPNLLSYTKARLALTLHVAPTGSPTMQWGSGGAVGFKYKDDSGTKQFVTSTQAKIGHLCDCWFDGTDVLLQNPLPLAPPTFEHVDVRQAIQYGDRTAAGQPNLIPQSQIGNTLAAGVTLKGTTAPFMVSVGQGFNTDGSQNNVNRVVTTDVTFTFLTASSTIYLMFNAETGATTSQTLADSFQRGGAISSTANVFTYDYLAHIMYVGNGTIASPAPWICVAEIDTNATVVTAIRVRQYGNLYHSGFIPTLTAAGGTYTLGHNFGTTEFDYTEPILNTTTDQGYAVGRVLDNIGGSNASLSAPATYAKSNSTIVSRRPSATAYRTGHATTGADATLTLASWSYAGVAKRRF